MKINAIIPIRYFDACFSETGEPRYFLKGEPLWAYTFRHALEAKGLDRIIVAHDDNRFEIHLEKWGSKIESYLRPSFLSLQGTSTLDVVDYLASQTKGDDQPDYWMLMEISHPLRPKGIVDQLIDNIQSQPADSLITVNQVRYNFWLKNEELGMERIVGGGEKPGVQIFKELVGICSMFSSHSLGSGNPFGEKVNMVPISNYWSTVDVRDDDSCWLAEQYLKKIGQK